MKSATDERNQSMRSTDTVGFASRYFSIAVSTVSNPPDSASADSTERYGRPEAEPRSRTRRRSVAGSDRLPCSSTATAEKTHSSSEDATSGIWTAKLNGAVEST